MKKLLSVLTILIGFSANAGIINSTLYDTESLTGSSIAATLDIWHFTAHSDTLATFDILSYERDASGSPIDHNGDGEFAFFDSMIWLFRDDGNLDATDLIAVNDDMDTGFGTLDGSTWSTDSYLSQFLTAGSYFLMVGTCCDDDATRRIDFTNLIQNWGTLEGIDATGSNLNSSSAAHYIGHGDYRLTYSGDITLNNIIAVSEPQTAMLFMLALIGAIWHRRQTFIKRSI